MPTDTDDRSATLCLEDALNCVGDPGSEDLLQQSIERALDLIVAAAHDCGAPLEALSAWREDHGAAWSRRDGTSHLAFEYDEGSSPRDILRAAREAWDLLAEIERDSRDALRALDGTGETDA